MAMTPYFYLSWLNEVSMPVAKGVDDLERDQQLVGAERIQHWIPPRLLLDSERLIDYLPNNLGMRLCSQRMHEVIDAGLGARDIVQWLPATVADTLGITHEYFTLHLPGDNDVLSETQTIMTGSFVVKPVIDATKVKGRNIFRLPGAMLTTFVTQELQMALTRESITGAHFEAAATARAS